MKNIISQKSVFRLRIVDVLFAIMIIVNLALPNITVGGVVIRAAIILMFEGYVLILGSFKKGNVGYYILWGISFFAYAFLSLNWSKYPQGVYDQINNVFWAISMNIFIARYIVVYKVKLQSICRLMILCLIIIIVNTILTGQFNMNDLRLTIGINENTYGMIISNIGFFILTYSIIQKKHLSLLWMFPVIILVFLSGSRKALLSCVFYIIFMLSENNRKNILQKVTITLLLISFFMILIIKVDFFYNIIGYRMVNMLNYFDKGITTDGSMISRINMTELAWHLFRESPILGVGLNNFKYYTYYNTYAHNNYLELLCGLGIVGLTIYYFPILIIYIKMLFIRKKLTDDLILPIGILTMFFVLDVANVSYFSFSDHIFLGIAIGYYYRTKMRYRISMTKGKNV